jgi:hypothetical protein
MPEHLFWGCVRLDHSSAVRADIRRQNYTVCPRHWYVDTTFKCAACGELFVFTVAEQRRWYEDLRFFIDSRPKHCPACRRDMRRSKALRQEYDGTIQQALQSDDVALKRRLADVIDELAAGHQDLPAKIHEQRRILQRQIDRLGRQADA